jgi:hypothetical protein
MFTKGQMNRMRACFAVDGPRHALLSSNGFSGTPIVEPPVTNPSKNETTSSLQLYPNPTQKKLVIQFQQNIDCVGHELIIVNQFGQVVKRIVVEQYTTIVDVNALQSGIYFVKLAGANKYILEKFLKQ